MDGPCLKACRMMMKKLILVMISVLFVVLTCKSMPAFAAMGEAGSVRLIVGVPADRAPVFYIDEKTGEITGIGVDLMLLAADEAGYEISFKEIKEETLKDALDNPEYDLVMPFGSAVQSTMGKASVVSDSFLDTPFTLVTKEKQSLPSINNLRVGMLKSLAGAAETIESLFPGIEMVMFETMSDSVKALRAGSVDALLHNSYVWSYYLQKPSYSDLVVQPSAMFTVDFRAGTIDDAEGKEIIEKLNVGIGKITDPQRQAIILDHTTRKLYHYDFGDYLRLYGLAFIMGTLLFIFLIISILFRQKAFQLEHEEKMRQMVDHDPLTGVYSLNGFRKRVEELLRENPDIPYTISYTNIIDFKYINDRYGWEAGDEFLKFWTSKSLEYLTDKEAIGRVDADHIIVLRIIGGKEQLNADDELIFKTLRNYFIDRGKDIKVRISSGIYVLMPEDYQNINVERMLDYARVAEKRVQDDTKDGYDFYNPGQWEKGRRDTNIINHLPKALETGEIQVWYQPQVDYVTGKVVGAEALCRWRHVNMGFISPAEFVPALEEAGLILDLDKFVWERVCQDLNRWKEQGHSRELSVNLSRCDIKGKIDIPSYFNDLVKKYGLDPKQLRIEITETAYVEDSELLIQTTTRLREYGFHVEMDDFGSGYSSLNMLKEVPVDKIKMDLRFLTRTGDPKMGRIIIEHIIAMIQDLGMDVLAEGIETKEQAEALKKLGCVKMQGFYFYRPMPVGDYEKLW